MLIRYTGDAGARHLGDWHWTSANGKVVEVADADAIQNLLTLRDFAVAAADPLAQIVGVKLAAELSLHEIVGVDDLARVGPERIEGLAQALAVTPLQVNVWIGAAGKAAYREYVDSARAAWQTQVLGGQHG